jgi:hypothetical protein
MLLLAKSWEGSTRGMAAPNSGTIEHEVEQTKSIVNLQPFRQATSNKIKSNPGTQGTATLINLNPAVNSWYLLEVNWQDGSQSSYHLENPQPRSENLFLDPQYPLETLGIPATCLKAAQTVRWTRRGIRKRPIPHCVMDGYS